MVVRRTRALAPFLVHKFRATTDIIEDHGGADGGSDRRWRRRHGRQHRMGTVEPVRWASRRSGEVLSGRRLKRKVRRDHPAALFEPIDGGDGSEEPALLRAV